MEITQKTIEVLAKIIIGDDLSFYRSGPKLVKFFNKYGVNKIYEKGFPPRLFFAEDQLRKLNEKGEIKKVIEDIFDPRDYLESNFEVESVVSYFNQYLIHDGFEVIKSGLRYRVIEKDGCSANILNFRKKFSEGKDNHVFILEQSSKCKEKLESNDFDGAITNARSMVEAVFKEILNQSGVEIPEYDGDLNKLYKEVKRYLNLDPGKKDLTETLKQILSGLNSIVVGIAGISNKMGDRHVRKYKPKKHHALLTIDIAHALCEFLVSSLEYQLKTGNRTKEVTKKILD